MYNKIIITTFAIAFLVGISGVAQAASIGPAEKYNPQVDPAEFSTNINNPYFSVTIGQKMVYEGQTPKGKERVEILVPGWTAKVAGVETLIYWDKVYLNDVLIEDTRDYLAQSKNGDVWYFGEHSDSYENGKLKDHHGSWLAGVNGGKPGIWMVANPQVGDEFRNEYLKGQAEDRSKILALNEPVTVQFGSFTGCVKTFESTPLEPAKTENKYYCKQIGSTALEVDLPSPEEKVAGKSELISVDLKGALGTALPAAYASEGVIASSQSGSQTSYVGGEKDVNDNEREDSGGWLGIIISGLVGLVGGVLIQKFVLGKPDSRIS